MNAILDLIARDPFGSFMAGTTIVIPAALLITIAVNRLRHIGRRHA